MRTTSSVKPSTELKARAFKVEEWARNLDRELRVSG
jgi:hypothetical protein